MFILSFDDVTLQFFVQNVCFCVLKHIKFKFYEKTVLFFVCFLVTTLGINMIENKDKPVNYKLFTGNFINSLLAGMLYNI